MIELNFQLRFSSDWHINAGYGMGSVADAVLERGANGMPIISGSTLKGLFRDALHDLGSIDYIMTAVGGDLTTILGSPKQKSFWRFSQATVTDLPSITIDQAKPTEDGSAIVTGVRVNPRTRRAEDGMFYQREMGSQELIFNFTIEGEGDQIEVEWLMAAASYIRRLGGRRRRGTGACTISLMDGELQAALLDTLEQRYFVANGQPQVIDLPQKKIATPHQVQTTSRRFRVILRTDEPLIIAHKAESGNNFQSQTIIPGRTLRGALAECAKPESIKNTDAYWDAFVPLFMLGGIYFDNLAPLVTTEDKREGVILDKAPLGLKKIKPENDSKVEYLLSTFSETERLEGKEYKKFIALEAGVPPMDEIGLQMRIHVQIDPELKRASTGNLYSYEAIPAGNYYVGELCFQSNYVWHEFAALTGIGLETPFTLRLGKATGRGYGKCTVWIEPHNEAAPPLWSQVDLEERLKDDENKLFITLASDAILVDTWGRSIQRFNEDWLAPILGLEPNEIAFIKSPLSQTRQVESFDTRSGLPYWRDVALVKGSTACLEFKDQKTLPGLKAKLAEIEASGIGLRRNEGFGRVIFNHPVYAAPNKYSKFAAPIPIPGILRPQPAPVKHLSEFKAEWAKTLEKESFDDFKNPIYRTLARRLVEANPANVAALVTLIEGLGTPQTGKYKLTEGYMKIRPEKNLFSEKSQSRLLELAQQLETLTDEQPRFWRVGLVLLAERILNRVREEETKER